MKVTVSFDFAPGEYVIVVLLDLKYNGRVQRVMADGKHRTYEVQYADDRGDLKTGWFEADELVSK